MTVEVYQVDAFVGPGCAGNAAGVCVLPEAMSEHTMQEIATAMGLAETAFVFSEATGEGAEKRIRWFTPTVEVDLCGHATLAAGWVLAREKGESGPWHFQSRSGPLSVWADGDRMVLDFPAQRLEPRDVPRAIREGLGATAVEECLKAQVPSGNWLVRVADEEAVRDLTVDLASLATLPEGGVIVTAPGRDCDIVSRFFAPNYGIDEDAVTGSAHCALVPYWAPRLNRNRLSARQLSQRGGELFCELRGDRVAIAGHARLEGVWQV